MKNVSAADSVPRLAVTSTAKEWAETARTLFDKRRYLQASRSYERANMMREKEVARAYYLREQAQKMATSRATITNSRKAAFLEAAGAFLVSAEQASTRRSEKLAYYRIAAECYHEADDLEMSAKAYMKAEQYTQAALVFRRGGFFDEAVDTVKTHKDKVRPMEAQIILNVAKMHYFKQQDLE